MDVTYFNAFIDGVKGVLSDFGVTDVHRGQTKKRDMMKTDMDVTVVIGIAGEVNGNIAFCFTTNTAFKIYSLMTGREITGKYLDEMAMSAIGEFANMIAGRAIVYLANKEKNFLPTPPTLVVGLDILFIINTVESIVIDMETSIGKIKINVGIEV